MTWLFTRTKPLIAFVSAILIILTSSWAADGLKGEALFSTWWPPLAQQQLLVTALTVLLFIGISAWVYRNRQIFTLARNLSRHLCEPHTVVILLVSPPNTLPATVSPLFPLRLTAGQQSVDLQGVSLIEDIAALGTIRWNWQQLLRAIVPHSATIQRLHLIGSPEPTGSFQNLALCQRFLEHYLPGVDILHVQEPVDFEDFNALVRCMREIIADEKRRGMHEHDIIIDVTGGIKTASIAGASITFNSQVTFQYVQTQPPNEVYAYDVVYQSPYAAET